MTIDACMEGIGSVREMPFPHSSGQGRRHEFEGGGGGEVNLLESGEVKIQ